MKLLHLSANIYPEFGDVNFTKNIWLELSKETQEYHILCRSDTQKYSITRNGNIFFHRIPFIVETSGVFILSSFFIIKIIKKYHITHIITQSPLFGGLAGVVASKYYKIPILTEIHGNEYFDFLEGRGFRNFILSRIIGFVLRNSTKIRALNNVMLQKLADFGFVGNVVTIPGRVDLSIFSPPKSQYTLNIGAIKLVTVGRFVKEKNYELLLEILLKSDLDFELCMVGKGPLLNKYNVIINKFNHDNVKIVDWVNQQALVELITQADLYIQSSVSEGLPRTILEAMALGMPIISTNVGSISGLVKNEVNGILIDDIESDLLIAINKLLTDEKMRRRLGENALHLVRHSYEWNKVFEHYRRELKDMKY
jgi:glycosyltransferase involved in cell wall biosynthesis